MAKQMKLVPLTREFLREFYKDLPIDPVPNDVEIKCNELKNQLENLKSFGPQGLQEQFLADKVKRIDEAIWRNREQCEEIADNLKSENLAKKEIKLKEGKVSDEVIKLWMNNMTSLCQMAQKGFDIIKSWQDTNIQRITKLVEKFLPSDFRLSIVKAHRERQERYNTAEIDKVIKSGAPIRTKYDLFWKQQMARRESLASVANANGVFKFVIKWLGGVPQELLDFIKQLNDDEGPLEEQRIKYGPKIYYLLDYGNKINTILAQIVNSECTIPFESTPNKTNITDLTDLCTKAFELYIREIPIFLTVLGDVLVKSPFFITPEQAAKYASANDKLEMTINAAQKFEFNIEAESGSQVMYEFTLQSKDIGFSVVREVKDGESEEIVPYQKFTSDKPIKNIITVKTTGTYKLVWDNSYSYWNKKTINYQCIVIKADNGPVITPSEVEIAINDTTISTTTTTDQEIEQTKTD